MKRSFEAADQRINYLLREPTGERTAGTLVLLHAFPLASDMWRPQLAAVPGGWRILAPDFGGFGESSSGSSASPSMEDYAREVLALLDHARVDAAVVGGCSMGGYVAFALHRLAPARVRGLVLADTRPEADTESARAARQQTLDTLEGRGAAGVAESMLPKLLGATSRSSRPAVVAAVRSLAASQPAEGVRRAVLALRSRPDSTALLANIAVPTLIVAGEEDEITGPDIARAMHGQVAGADLALIEKAGHLANLEQPEAFNAALSRFLSTRFA